MRAEETDPLKREIITKAIKSKYKELLIIPESPHTPVARKALEEFLKFSEIKVYPPCIKDK